jgi:O-antigen ligase
MNLFSVKSLRDFISFESLLLFTVWLGPLKNLEVFSALDQGYFLTFGLHSALIIVLLWFLLTSGIQNIHRSLGIFLIAYMLFVCYCLLQFMTTDVIQDYSQKKIVWVSVLGPALVIPSTIIMSSDFSRVDRFFKLNILLGCFVAVVSLYYNVITPPGMDQWAGTSLLGSGNPGSYQQLGRMSGFVLAIVIGYVIQVAGLRDRIVLAVVGVSLTAAILISATRQAFAGIGLVILLVFVKSTFSFKKLIVVAISLLLVIFLALLSIGDSATSWLLVPQFNTSALQSRLLEVTDEEGLSQAFERSQRPTLWRAALDLWEAHPLLGVGFGNFSLKSSMNHEYPHNIFLEILCELGLVGFFLVSPLFLMPIISIAFTEVSNGPDFAMALWCVWIYWLTCSIFSSDMLGLRLLYLFGGLCIVASPRPVTIYFSKEGT